MTVSEEQVDPRRRRQSRQKHTKHPEIRGDLRRREVDFRRRHILDSILGREYREEQQGSRNFSSSRVVSRKRYVTRDGKTHDSSCARDRSGT
jgi:hypothetical protein